MAQISILTLKIINIVKDLKDKLSGMIYQLALIIKQ